MSGSRSPSPAAKEQSSNESDGALSSANDNYDASNKQGQGYVCPSVHHHPGLTIPNPNAPMHMSDSGSAKKKFKYVKPRLGSNFQAKIAPFRPKRNMEDSDELNLFMNGTASLASTTTSAPKKKRAGRPPKGGRAKQQESNEPLIYDPTLKSKRGGLCIHRPSILASEPMNPPTTHTHDEYLTFCRNLTSQTPKDHNHTVARADHLWKDALENHIFRAMKVVVRVQEKKKGRKRKLEQSESGVSIATSADSSVSGVNGNVNANGSLESARQSLVGMDVDDCGGDADSCVVRDVALGMESDDRMLEYLQVNGSGKAKRAQFLMIVELCRGTAVRTRRRIRKVKKADELTVPLSAVLAPMSDSWIRRYERIGPTIIGDHRRNPDRSKYPYFDHGDSSSSSVFPWTRNWDSDKGENVDNGDHSKIKSDETVQQSINANWGNFESVKGDESLTNAWACILEKGQLILENQKNGNKPAFADLFIVLNKAYSMPKPEEVYQKRDTMPKQISQCLNSILDFVENGKEILAHLVDAMYDDSNNGVELQTLRKTIDSKDESCNVQLEEINIAREMLNETLQWESRLTESGREESSSSEDLHLPQQSLASAEELASEGRNLSLRPNSLAFLEDRIHRAFELRNRIRMWSKNNGNEKDSVKYIGSMIKEANKINLSFQELSLLSKVHRNAEEWMDRANVALRSKISLRELESLVKTGEKMPLGLTGSLEKLQSRYKQVCEWIEALKVEVPCPLESMGASGCDLDAGNRAEWLLRMRKTLKGGSDDTISALVELLSQGSRLPVEIDFLQLLQTAIDARNWSQKARRWVPSAGDQFKRGKIEDLQDHLDSSNDIIKKAKQLTDGKTEWQLDYADELQSTVDIAETWFETYRPYLTGDNRRANSRNSISYNKLRKIVVEAEQIPTNLGNPFTKINRIHSEAKDWMDTNLILLQRCGVEFGGKADTTSMNPVSIDEVNSAIESAAKELAVDLDEVKVLKEMADQSQDWFDQALKFAPKRNKRVVGSKKDTVKKCTLDTVISLIESASSIPMDTTADVGRLQLLLSDVQSWRLESQMKIKDIASVINSLVHERNKFYGEPGKFLDEDSFEPMDVDEENGSTKNNSSTSGLSSNISGEPASASSNGGDGASAQSTEKSGNDVHKMVENLNKSTDSLHILTLEEEIVRQLEVIMKWCKKISVLIDSHENVFIDKRWKKDLDILISEGSNMNLEDDKFTVPMPADGSEEKIMLEVTTNNVLKLVSGDSARLLRLRTKRDDYYSWCKKANETYIESDRRVPHQTLLSLAKECSIYPSNAETVKRITKDAKVAVAWIEDVKTILDAGEKMSLEEVKNKLNKLSRVKITSHEYRSLRKAHQNAKNWTTKVKKSGLHNGSAQIHVLKELLREHDELIIAVPEEFEELKQTLCGYCICRRPYEGFMIGCDDCDEWYHGPCIGVSQSQGDRMEKYVCVRCCVKRVYKISSNKIAQIVRKWCDPKDLSKARSQDNQKHQRKIREKKREIVKWKEECQASVTKLQWVKAQKLEITNAPEAPRPQAADARLSLPINDQVAPTAGENNATSTELDNAAKWKEEEALATANITKATSALEQANRKMIEFTKVANERKINQRREDQLSPCFRYWAAMIGGKVLAPESIEIAEKSLPKPTTSAKAPSQLLSEPMKEVLMATKDLGIGEYPDIAVVRDAFQCIGWCCLAFDILMKKPKIDDLRCLLKLSDLIKLPEVKSAGMIRSMINRTSVWRQKVKKTLTPIASETKPFNAAILKELGIVMSTIPVITPEEVILCNAILDEGERHCVCGGPRDETVMTCCISCKKWYHRKCLNALDATQSENWKCTFCENGASSMQKNKNKSNNPHLFWPFLGAGENDISSHAPLATKLWPPFGLASSPEALTSLGLALTYKIEKMEKPKPKKPESIDDIVKKAVSATKSGTAKSQPQVASSVQLIQTHQTIVKTRTGPTPTVSQSTSMLTMRFPSFGAGQVPNTGNITTSVPGAVPQSNTNVQTLLSGRHPNLNQGNVPTASNGHMNVVAKEGQTAVPSQQSMMLSVTTNGKTISAPVKVNTPVSKSISVSETVQTVNAPVVEGLATGVVQDALMVARSIAESTPIIQIATIAVKPGTLQNTATIPNSTVSQNLSVKNMESATSTQNSMKPQNGISEIANYAALSVAATNIQTAGMNATHTQTATGSTIKQTPSLSDHIVAKGPVANANPHTSTGTTLNQAPTTTESVAATAPSLKSIPTVSIPKESPTDTIVIATKTKADALVSNGIVQTATGTGTTAIPKDTPSTLLNGVVAAASTAMPPKEFYQQATVIAPNTTTLIVKETDPQDSNEDEKKTSISS